MLASPSFGVTMATIGLLLFTAVAQGVMAWNTWKRNR